MDEAGRRQMLAAFLLVTISVYSTGEISTRPRQQGPLKQASTRPDPVTSARPNAIEPDQQWPPAGVFRPGGEVTPPQVTKEVAPNYTPAAMKAKVQGLVSMEAVVLTDGTVGDVRIVRSLDTQHGLDEEAIKTLKKFRFTPGKKNGAAVPVIAEVQMSFSMR